MPTDQDDSELMISEEPLDLYWNDNVYEPKNGSCPKSVMAVEAL